MGGWVPYSARDAPPTGGLPFRRGEVLRDPRRGTERCKRYVMTYRTVRIASNTMSVRVASPCAAVMRSTSPASEPT